MKVLCNTLYADLINFIQVQVVEFKVNVA